MGPFVTSFDPLSPISPAPHLPLLPSPRGPDWWEGSASSALPRSAAPQQTPNTQSIMPGTLLPALPALLLPLLGLAAAGADCPPPTWIQFQDSCYLFIQEAIKVGSIEDVRNKCASHGADMISIHNEEENTFILDILKKQQKKPDDILLGMFFDTDDASFKWFDKSNMTFDKWADQDDEELVDTCAFLHTKTGGWKKGNCEISSVEGTICKRAIPYEKEYLSDNHILVSALVIASTVILTVLGAIAWFLYKRNLYSGFTTIFSIAPQSPYDDDCVLVVEEEN